MRVFRLGDSYRLAILEDNDGVLGLLINENDPKDVVEIKDSESLKQTLAGVL